MTRNYITHPSSSNFYKMRRVKKWWLTECRRPCCERERGDCRREWSWRFDWRTRDTVHRQTDWQWQDVRHTLPTSAPTQPRTPATLTHSCQLPQSHSVLTGIIFRYLACSLRNKFPAYKYLTPLQDGATSDRSNPQLCPVLGQELCSGDEKTKSAILMSVSRNFSEILSVK